MIRVALLSTLALILLVASATPGLTQGSGLGGPSHAFQARLGVFVPSGGGDLWDDNEQLFTLNASDFVDFAWGLNFIASLNNNVEIGVNFDRYRSTVSSAYREFTDDAGFPIIHDTRLVETPLTIDFRLLPGGRYRTGPHGGKMLKPVFYVGGGGGLNVWSYEEAGEFIDFSTFDLEIFPARFRDNGTTWEAHALAGIELPLNPGFNLLLEGRYSWSRATLGGDLAGLGEIELGGAAVFLGGSFRF
jgi:hypothetical protein